MTFAHRSILPDVAAAVATVPPYPGSCTPPRITTNPTFPAHLIDFFAGRAMTVLCVADCFRFSPLLGRVTSPKAQGTVRKKFSSANERAHLRASPPPLVP